MDAQQYNGRDVLTSSNISTDKAVVLRGGSKGLSACLDRKMPKPQVRQMYVSRQREYTDDEYR